MKVQALTYRDNYIIAEVEFPELFTDIFSESKEIIHPAGDGITESSEITIGLRWEVDALTGEVKTVNPNALRLEAELLK